MGRKVVIKDTETGKYLNGLGQLGPRGGAHVFDTDADQVAYQLQEVHNRFGATWVAEEATDAVEQTPLPQSVMSVVQL